MRRGLSLKEECEIKRKEAEENSKMSRDRHDRGRGRGGGRDRGRPGAGGLPVNNRTDSDDPKLLNARVFIGNLATDKTSRMELEEKFQKYGNTSGITMFRGYGFVQFDNEENARAAVESENGGLYKGMRMDVKMAAEGRNSYMRDGPGAPRGRGKGGHGGPGRMSPPPLKARRLDTGYDDIGHRRTPREETFADDPYRRPPARDPFYDHPRDAPYRRDPFLADPFRDPYREPLPPPAGYEPPPIDCVIFTLGRRLEPYAETIVRRLHAFGVIASILPLSDESNIKPAMEDVTQRGTPFTIVVNEQNAVHQSCTVSILHGFTQEHRNMPLEDAMALLESSFQTYLKDEKEKAAKDPSSAYKHLPPGEQMQYLLNLLSDNHYLSADELTKVINYLEDRKKKVIAHEMGTSAVAMEQEKTINKQQQELQAKILSILGPDTGAKQQDVGPVAPPHVPTSQSTFGNANSVQQALDNLMHSGSDLLQNLADVTQSRGLPQPERNLPGPYGHLSQQHQPLQAGGGHMMNTEQHFARPGFQY